MIFDCEAVTELVLEWQDTQDIAILGEILQESTPLVEAIVSTFDSSHRDDLIQESLLKIQVAIPMFDPNISNLYNFLATVIRNVCITYLKKQGRNLFGQLDIDTEEYCYLDFDYTDSELLRDVVIRNRSRFPSIPVSEIDDITEFIISSISMDGKKLAGIISELTTNFGIDRHIAIVIYNSTLVYLRYKLKNNADSHIAPTDEFSIIRDLEELVGENVYSTIALLFHGIYIRIS